MAAIRIAIVVLPLQRIVNVMNGINRRWPRTSSAPIEIRRAARRITQAAAYCPIPTTCWSRTIAAHFLMSRLGFVSVPKVGVSKGDGNFAAHAWLECRDEILIGSKSPDGRTYTAVPSLERFFA